MKQKICKIFWGENKYICLSEVAIGIITGFFLFRLNKLNKILLQEFSNADIIIQIRLLQYNNYQPLKYFIFAIMLVLIEVYLIAKIVQKIRDCEFEMADMLLSFLMIAINVLSLVCIIKGITIPILKAIIKIMVLGYAITKVSSS